MHQPLGLLAFIYAVGLIIGYYCRGPILLLFIVSILMLGVACFVKRQRFIFLAAAVLVIGWLQISLRASVLAPHDLRRIVARAGEVATIRGTLAHAPSERVKVRDEEESWRTLALLDVDAIQRSDGAWRPAYGRVLTITSGTLAPDYFVGRKVEVRGALVRPSPPALSGVFDYQRHLAARGVYFQLKASSEDQWECIDAAQTSPWSARFIQWAQKTLAHGIPERDRALQLQWAMLLGWQTALTAEVSEPFMRSGTMHIFAISGLHIALIAAIFAALFRALGAPRWLAAILVILIIWFYTAASGWQSSALRSTVMMTVVAAGWALHRPANILNSLVVAALLILAWDPMQLFQASFQLSFFTVLSIALLNPGLERLETRLIPLDPFLPFELRPLWQQWSVSSLRFLWRFFTVSLAATAGSLPLVAYYFNLFTPGSLLANLAVVPASAAALASGLGAIVIAPVAPPIAELFNHSGWMFMQLMIWLSEWVANLPGSWMHVRSPGLLGFVLYYGLLIATLVGAFSIRRLRWPMALTFALLLIGAGWQHFAWRRSAEIAVLPLVRTHAVLVREGGQTRYSIVSCGSADGFPFSLSPVLKARGVNKLSYVLLPRSDVPHSSALPQVLSLFPPRFVALSPHRSRSNPFRAMFASIETNIAVVHATNGTVLPPWQIVHPAAEDRFTRGQEYAVCALGVFGGRRVLLLPDLGRTGQNALFERGDDLRADIVIAGLPDSGEPLADELIDRIKPSLIIIADSEFPISRRASPELRDRLGARAIPVLYTHQTGELILSLDDRSLRIEQVRK